MCETRSFSLALWSSSFVWVSSRETERERDREKKLCPNILQCRPCCVSCTFTKYRHRSQSKFVYFMDQLSVKRWNCDADASADRAKSCDVTKLIWKSLFPKRTWSLAGNRINLRALLKKLCQNSTVLSSLQFRITKTLRFRSVADDGEITVDCLGRFRIADLFPYSFRIVSMESKKLL